MIPFKDNIDRSVKEQDHMKMGELAMVTDTHCDNGTVAYILPLYRQNNKEGDFTGRVYMAVFCTAQKILKLKDLVNIPLMDGMSITNLLIIG